MTDDILTLAPDCEPDSEEYGLRAKLRSYRNAATAMVHSTDSDTARALAWTVIEYVTWVIYSPASEDLLRDLNKFCRRLMLTAMQAEEIDT